MSDGTVIVAGGGWWPPGQGEPGQDWEYEAADLRLYSAGDNLEVSLPTADGERALVSVPLDGVLEAMLAARTQGTGCA